MLEASFYVQTYLDLWISQLDLDWIMEKMPDLSCLENAFPSSFNRASFNH